ncbi:MerR family DNA-binding transcriptional regulator [Streptomyces sp. NBC_00859]|nr:MerR family DNA-binding transcriptional regulator [Streptomyces sp. NBC_00859]
MTASATWKAGPLAEAGGLTVRSLHHWDTIGLLSPSRRTAGGHRAGRTRRADRCHLRPAGHPHGRPVTGGDAPGGPAARTCPRATKRGGRAAARSRAPHACHSSASVTSRSPGPLRPCRRRLVHSPAWIRRLVTRRPRSSGSCSTAATGLTRASPSVVWRRSTGPSTPAWTGCSR